MPIVPLKREVYDATVAAACPISLKERLKEYAKEQDVSESAALRHILSVFFEDSFRNSKENLEMVQS